MTTLRRRLIPLLIALALLLAGRADAQEATPTPDADALGEGIAYGLQVTGVIDNNRPRAVYIFEGQRGEVVDLRLVTTRGDLDPMLMLLDNSGSAVAVRDDSAGGRNVVLDDIRLPVSDRYFVVVGRFGYGQGTTSGSYELTVERVGVSSASGSGLRYGDSIINTIDSATPVLYYSFRAERGDVINISMERISGSLDTYLQVANSSAVVIADNDDVPNSGSLDAAITGLVIQESGTYIIVASRFGQAAGDSTGSFVLSLEEAADSGLGNSPATALDIQPGETIEGELNDERYVQYFRFSAQRRDIVSVRMERVSGGLDTLVALADGRLNELVSNDDIEGSQNSAISSFLIPEDGEYFIVATRFEREAGASSGRFRLTLNSAGDAFAGVPADVQRIAYGATLTGSIDDSRPQALYAFYGQAGEIVTVSMSRGDGDLDPVVTIVDADGTVLAAGDDIEGSQNARIERYVLPESGIYYIQATRYSGDPAGGRNNTRGSYILVLAQRFE